VNFFLFLLLHQAAWPGLPGTVLAAYLPLLQRDGMTKVGAIHVATCVWQFVSAVLLNHGAVNYWGSGVVSAPPPGLWM
jgi:hypothetical protein